MTQIDAQADKEVKAKHRKMWALGNYPAVALEIIPELGPTLVEAAGVKGGDRVLDVAAGAGNAAIAAAQAGADVIASDLTPELFEIGKREAEKAGAELEWREADAEAMPFGDNEFDKVLSTVGVMFAPHHQESADELVRVTRPGGTIGLISWTPEGFIGQMFATMKPYAPPPPPGAQPPPMWGREDHVAELFGDRVTDLKATKKVLRVEHYEKPEDFCDYFKANYGPTIVAYKNIADDPDKVAALDRDLTELAQKNDVGSGRTVLEWEYLLVTARKKG